MKVIKPAVITASMLTSTTASETAPAVYSGATTYAANATASVASTAGLINVYQSLQAANVGHTPASSPLWWRLLCTVYQAYNPASTYAAGDRVQDNSKHLVYQSLVGANTGNALTDPTKWAAVGANNRWAMFDEAVGTSTAVASPLFVVLRPGATSGIGLLEIVGRDVQIVMKDAPGGTVVYDRTVDLDGSIIESFYDWFFADYEQLSDLVLTDLPEQFAGCELAITVTASDGDASCGVCKPGKVVDLGVTRAGARVSIVDYSVKSIDAFGTTTVTERPYTKRANFDLLTEKYRFNSIYRTLAALRATPAVYIGTDQLGFEPLLVYGYFRDFSISVDYPQNHLCSLEVEGLI